jgi:hypothetical protein
MYKKRLLVPCAAIYKGKCEGEKNISDVFLPVVFCSFPEINTLIVVSFFVFPLTFLIRQFVLPVGLTFAVNKAGSQREAIIKGKS